MSAMHRLRLGEMEDVRVLVARAPNFSLMYWLLDATVSVGRAAGGARGATMHRPDMRASIRPAVAALGMPGLDRVPDCIMPIDVDNPSIDDHVTRLADSSGEELTEQIGQLWSGSPPPPWRFAADHPRMWLRSLAEVTRDLWTTTKPRWAHGQEAIEREVARIGTAAVTGTLDALLNSLHPRLGYQEGSLQFVDTGCNVSVHLTGRPLILVPMLARRHQVAVSFGGDDFAFAAYPVPAPVDDEALRAKKTELDRLAAVLGPLRAGALRALSRPQMMRNLAASIRCVPSTATYHCDHLEAAGLIVRERRAQSVWVRRTRRGDELVALLDD